MPRQIRNIDRDSTGRGSVLAAGSVVLVIVL